jgi:hypothetical protein
LPSALRRVSFAKMAELVDAQVLGTCAVRRESSSLSFRTILSQLI